ncbi:mitochondrial import receptor subunit tom22 [Dipodascopsis tothii]|uniref:mitochondrial import receptor subunit tom22 n=1 Tax=Dipodascopsis tothii TaxID=44089 RepID=UPI0034D0032B
MVQIEAIAVDEEKRKPTVVDEQDEDYETTSSASEAGNDSDDEYDADEELALIQSESIAERLAALKDVIPPQYRSLVASSALTTYNAARASLLFGGRAFWVVATSTMLLGIPLSLSVLDEQRLVEQEKGMQMSAGSNEILAPGADSAFLQPAPAN